MFLDLEVCYCTPGWRKKPDFCWNRSHHAVIVVEGVVKNSGLVMFVGEGCCLATPKETSFALDLLFLGLLQLSFLSFLSHPRPSFYSAYDISGPLTAVSLLWVLTAGSLKK